MSQPHNNVYFVTKGTIASLKMVTGKVNSFEPIQKSNNVAAAITGAIGDMYGMAANSAMLATDEDEDADRFALTLDYKVISSPLDARPSKDADATRAAARRTQLKRHLQIHGI